MPHRVLLLLLAVFLLLSPRAIWSAQDRVVLSPGAPIPTGYQTYTLFLFPSSDWLDRTADLDTIKKAFRAFGDVIGPKHLAVWFLDLDGQQISLERSKHFSDRLNLDYNEGPFVIASTVHPEALWPQSAPVIIKLHGISSARVVGVLNVLEQDLRTARDIRRNQLLVNEVWARLASNSNLIELILGN